MKRQQTRRTVVRLAVQPSVRCTIRAQLASASGERRAMSSTLGFDMTNMEVEFVRATSCVLARQKCLEEEDLLIEEGMPRVWQFAMARKFSWKTCGSPREFCKVAVGGFRDDVAELRRSYFTRQQKHEFQSKLFDRC